MRVRNLVVLLIALSLVGALVLFAADVKAPTKALVFKGKPKESPLDQFTPPKSLDDIFTGGSPRGAREITGGAENPAGMESSFFNDPRFNGPQEAVPYDPAKGFQGLDAKFAADKNAKTLSEALAKARKGDDSTLGMGRAAVDSDLIKLLMAYGAFGGMSAGALATLDAQKNAQKPGM